MLRNKTTGAPSFAPFAKGGIPQLLTCVLWGPIGTFGCDSWYPPFAKGRGVPGSCYAALYMATCAAFYKESRMRFCGTKTNRKSGALIGQV
jgi:hypothetical protein